jgi:hypothetical protein
MLVGSMVARFFSALHAKTGENIPNGGKNRPNSHKIYQNLPSQVPPKLTQIRIFGLKICHLATPVGSAKGAHFFPFAVSFSFLRRLVRGPIKLSCFTRSVSSYRTPIKVLPTHWPLFMSFRQERKPWTPKN